MSTKKNSYNSSRPFTKSLWRRVQTIVETEPDGVPGPKTEAAIREYQSANGLTVDGCCGPLTLAHMDEGLFEVLDGELHFPACKLAVDADGSVDAYHPDNVGIDYLRNAGIPGNWWGIATDPLGQPYIQGPDDPRTGFYVSTTAAVRDRTLPASDPARYFDSRTVLFVALPKNFYDLLPDGYNVRKGETTLDVERHNTRVEALYVDVASHVLLEPDRHVNNVKLTNKRLFGEGSIALLRAIGHDPFELRGHTWRAAVGISSSITMTLRPE